MEIVNLKVNHDIGEFATASRFWTNNNNSESIICFTGYIDIPPGKTEICIPKSADLVGHIQCPVPAEIISNGINIAWIDGVHALLEKPIIALCIASFSLELSLSIPITDEWGEPIIKIPCKHYYLPHKLRMKAAKGIWITLERHIAIIVKNGTLGAMYCQVIMEDIINDSTFPENLTKRVWHTEQEHNMVYFLDYHKKIIAMLKPLSMSFYYANLRLQLMCLINFFMDSYLPGFLRGDDESWKSFDLIKLVLFEEGDKLFRYHSNQNDIGNRSCLYVMEERDLTSDVKKLRKKMAIDKTWNTMKYRTELKVREQTLALKGLCNPISSIPDSGSGIQYVVPKSTCIIVDTNLIS